MATDNTMQASIEVDLDDKAVKEGTQRITRSVTQMGRSVTRQSTRMGRSIQGAFRTADRTLNRFNSGLMKMGGIFAGGSTVRAVTQWRDELSSLGRELNATDSQAERLNVTLRDQSMQTGINTNKLSAYSRETARLTRSIDATTESLIAGSEAIAAWNLDVDQSKKLAAIHQHYGATTQEKQEELNDIITSLANKPGSHSASDSVDAMYQLMQGDYFSRDQEGFQSQLAIWQAIGGFSPNDNTTQAESYFNDMLREENRKFNLGKHGSEFVKQVEIDGVKHNVLTGATTWMDANESTKDGRMRKGIFLDQKETLSDKRFSEESTKAIMALSKQKNFNEDYFTIETGATSKLADATGRDFNATMNRLSNAFMKFADANLAEPLTNLADFINNLDSSELEQYFDDIETGLKVLAGIFVGQKILQNPRISVATASVVLGKYMIDQVSDHYNNKLDEQDQNRLTNEGALNRLITEEGLNSGGDYRIWERVNNRLQRMDFDDDFQRDQEILRLTKEQVSRPYMDRFREEDGFLGLDSRMVSIKKGAKDNDWYGADKDSSYGEWFLGGVEQGEDFGFSQDALKDLIPTVKSSVEKEREIAAILDRISKQQQNAEVNINITTDEGLKATISGTVSDGLRLKPNIKTGNQRKNGGEVF